MTRMLSAFLCAGILVAHADRAAAQAEPPVTVPPSSEFEPLDRAMKPALDERYSVLMKRFIKMNNSTIKWMAEYGGRSLPEGSPEATEGMRQKAEIIDSLNSYTRDVVVFDTEVSRLQRHRAVADAIAGAYKNSPRGVIEDIRNGFRAIDAGNWTAARISFKDALKREPSNLGIKRLVALCDHSLTAPMPVANALEQKVPDPAATMSQTDREAYLKILSKTEDAILARDFEGRVNDFYLDYAPKHPELKLSVKTVPATATPDKKSETTIESYIKRFQDLIRLPTKENGRTKVVAIVGKRG